MAFLHLNLSSNHLLPLPRPSHCSLRKSSSHLSSTLLTHASPLTKLEPPPVLEPHQDKSPALQDKHAPPPPPYCQKRDFYLNLGVAIRTLRDDLPSLFSKDLNYDIYREDITFIDSLNTIQGMDNYRLIFWALRFHGRILFREIRVDVFRVWQPSENSIWIRWEMQGVPRVPWEAKGRFQGTSRYKVDRSGKIYEHKVDNLAFNFPQTVARPATVLDFVAAACPPSPNLTFWGDSYDELVSCSWLELYRAVRGVLVGEEQFLVRAGLDSLVRSWEEWWRVVIGNGLEASISGFDSLSIDWRVSSAHSISVATYPTTSSARPSSPSYSNIISVEIRVLLKTLYPRQTLL